jgi:repressor LexA
MQRRPTPKQQRLLDYLQEAIVRDGAPPSLRQTARVLGISHAAVAQGLRGLEARGCLRRGGHYSRELELLPPCTAAPRWREVPLVGRIAAGLPMYAQTQAEGRIVLDAELWRGAQLFALRVRGDSMRDAGILDGDLAVCEPRQYARNGEIVVALIDGEEATVKRFFLRPELERIELRPENSAYSPMRYDFGRVLIQGKVVGILRGPDTLEHS